MFDTGPRGWGGKKATVEPDGVLLEPRAQGRSERELLLGRGDLCRDEGRIPEALVFYARTKAWDRLLSLDLSSVVFEELEGTSFLKIAQDIAERCPAETRRGHPFSMLCVAWALKVYSHDAAFAAVMGEMDGWLEADGPLRAEWLLLSAYLHYPDLERMIPALQGAAVMFAGACSRVILPEAPWAFGGYFQLTEFHLRAGEADREAEAFDEFIALYSRLTNGHGSGADALFRAELAHLRGDMANAEILAYKASFLAEGKGQSVVRLGAALTLANVALSKADATGWQRAIDSMERAMSRAVPNARLVRAALDMVRGTLLAELSAGSRIADWLKNRDFPSQMPPPMTLNALYVHALYLLEQGDVAQFIGILEASFREIGDKSAYVAFSLSLLLAAGYALAGEREKAAALFERGAALGLPDGFVIHFATYFRSFPELVADLLEKKYPHLLEKINAIRTNLDTGWKTLHDAVSEDALPSDLTAREREIALLAAEGLRNGEIAKRLFVTESTVRTHLRAVFQKLDIDRRAKLAEKLN